MRRKKNNSGYRDTTLWRPLFSGASCILASRAYHRPREVGLMIKPSSEVMPKRFVLTSWGKMIQAKILFQRFAVTLWMPIGGTIASTVIGSSPASRTLENGRPSVTVVVCSLLHYTGVAVKGASLFESLKSELWLCDVIACHGTSLCDMPCCRLSQHNCRNNTARLHFKTWYRVHIGT